MPLKNPKKVPGIPKSRVKSIIQIKESTPRAKESEIEYTCLVYFYNNKQKQEQQYCVRLETMKNFSMLNYEISVKFKKDKNSIDISILGLNTKTTYLNEPGPASCELLFSSLYGEHTINVIKQDGSLNSALFNFNVFKKEIELVKEFLPDKKNNRKFCNFDVARDRFTYSTKGV
ncbi:MAG TPA: hypothetical protein VKA26_00345 [Ignavibacteriaceae bacterium]|nr:hypothetical protein [Ignavibacteriaceae bacterium]